MTRSERDAWRVIVDDTYGDDIERFYEEGRDAVLDESLRPRGPDLLFQVVSELGLDSTWRVLDVGSRDGRHLIELVRRFGCQAIGVEPAPANLARQQRTYPDQRLKVARATTEALPLASDAFDLVWVRDVFGHVESLPSAFAECRRVMRPDGRLVVFHVFATDLLEPADAARLWASTAVTPSSADRHVFESSLTNAGLTVERREELHGEWQEHGEEAGDRKTSRQLLRVARMVRDPDRFRAALGDHAYDVELGNCLYGIYQLLGKLSAAIYVLR